MIKFNIGNGGMSLSIDSDNVTPDEIADKIRAIYPDRFDIITADGLLQVNGTPSMLELMHRGVMWHYIPNKCRESLRREKYNKDRGSYEGTYTYKF